MSPTPAPRRRLALSFAAGVCAAFAFARCGAADSDAPALDPSKIPPPSQCKSLEGYMPHFFELLRDPKLPLAGLRTLVVNVTSGSGTPANQADPLGKVMSSIVGGLKWYTADPWEVERNDDRRICYPVTPQNPLPTLPMCEVEASRDEACANPPCCENRMCALKRAIDFGIRDRAAVEAVDALRPLLEKILGYASNTQPGGDGISEHWEAFEVLSETSLDEAACPPEGLLQVLDIITLYFRNDASCSADGRCVGQKALAALTDLLNDPALDKFLGSYESAAGQGPRRAFIALANTLGDNIAYMPDSENPLDLVHRTLDDLLYPFLQRDEDFVDLEAKVRAVGAVLDGLLAPEVGLVKPLKQVLKCVSLHDGGRVPAGKPSGRLVGVLYDLLSKQGGTTASGLDVDEITGALRKLSDADKAGVLSSALHAVLASTLKDPKSMEALRILLSRVLTVENARGAVPALKAFIDDPDDADVAHPTRPNGPQRDALTELVVAIDNLIFGCSAND